MFVYEKRLEYPIHKVSVKPGGSNLIFTEVSGELMDDGSNHLQVPQLVTTPMSTMPSGSCGRGRLCISSGLAKPSVLSKTATCMVAALQGAPEAATG